MITDHVWRPPPSSSGLYGTIRSRAPMPERPCEYMNCRSPRAEHERSVSLKHFPGAS